MRDIYQISANEQKLRQLDRRDKVMKTFEVFVLAIVVIVTGFSLFQVSQISSTNQKIIKEHGAQVIEVGRENQIRLDVDLCIVSVPPQTRTPQYVKACYDDAEKLGGVKIQRFGYGQ